jgi:TolB-like protein/DNA-binding winged helix-turn-helix (wHTH) protein
MRDSLETAYSFQGFTIDPSRRELFREGQRVDVRPKSFDVLACLAANAGQLVSKGDLMQSVWPDVVVTDDSLTRCISDIRAALDDRAQRLVKTVPRRGYMLVAPMAEAPTASIPGSSRQGFATPQGPVSPAHVTRPAVAIARVGAASWSSLNRRPQILAGAVAVALLVCLALASLVPFSQQPVADTSNEPVVAVTPFAALDSSSQSGLLSRAISEDLSASLGRFGSLSVIAPSSVTHATSNATEPDAIARTLNARYIVQGSLRQSDERLRITARLVDTQSGKQLWSENYDRQPDALFALEDDISQRIVRALFSNLGKAELKRAALKPPSNRTAYDFTLQGNALMRKVQRENRGAIIASARALYQRALAADPGYAPAVNGLATTYLFAWLQPTPNSPVASEYHDPAIIARAEALARQAVDLDDRLAEPRATLGWVLNWMNRPREALAEYERALQINPNLVDGRYAVLLSHNGHAEEAVAYTTRIMRLDPLHPPNYTYYLGKAHFFAGRFEDGHPLIKSASDQMPTHLPPKVLLIAVTVLTNRPEEMRTAIEELLRIRPEFTISDWMRFMRLSHEPYAAMLVSALRKARLPE